MPIVFSEFLSYLAQQPLAWYLYISQVVLVFGLLIDTLEHLVNMPLFRNNGLFAGRVFCTAQDDYNYKPLRYVREWLCNDRSYVAVICLRLVFIVLLVLPDHSNFYYSICLSVLLVIEVLLIYRCCFGRDGSDQMDIVVLAGLLAAYLLLPNSSAAMGLWFIALQTILSYITSGVAKLVSPIWRSGDAFFRIFNTHMYGGRVLVQPVIKFPFIGVAACWTIMIFECVFIFALIMPAPILISLLFIGFLFHLFNAFVMGLNKFIWSWTASYPALVFCALQTTQFLSLKTNNPFSWFGS